jgi:flagellar secretion chaperone FliS
MNQQQIAGQYRQSSTQGVNRVGLVVRLYDAIIEDLRRAREAIRSGQVERRVKCVNHALLILAELESVLDQERGGQVARHLGGFYRVTRAMIVEANVRASDAPFARLMELFLPVRQAWQQAEQDFARRPQPEAAAPRPRAAYPAADADPEIPSSRWSV